VSWKKCIDATTNADSCVLFILVFLFAAHEAFPVLPNAYFVAAAEVNRMLPRFLTRQTRSNQRVIHERARATTRETAAPFATLPTLASSHTLLMHPALYREKKYVLRVVNVVLRPNTSVAVEFSRLTV
jgi:hypothetical protein